MILRGKSEVFPKKYISTDFFEGGLKGGEARHFLKLAAANAKVQIAKIQTFEWQKYKTKRIQYLKV